MSETHKFEDVKAAVGVFFDAADRESRILALAERLYVAARAAKEGMGRAEWEEKDRKPCAKAAMHDARAFYEEWDRQQESQPSSAAL